MPSAIGLVEHYGAIKLVHITCVALSGGVFTLRGGFMLANSPLANHRALARASVAIDTTLLLAALLLTRILGQYPFVQPWLTTKVLLLVVYVGLGIFALRRGRTRPIRAACFVGALAVFGTLIGVAVRHDPRGWFVGY